MRNWSGWFPALAPALRELADKVKVLGKADPARKTKIYADIGIELLFGPSKSVFVPACEAAQAGRAISSMRAASRRGWDRNGE